MITSVDSFLKKFFTFVILSRIALILFPLLVQILLLPEKNYSWNYWDAPHYIYIASHGYTNSGDPANFIVFLPLYPFILSLFNFFKNPEAVGIITSIVFFLAACAILYKLLLLSYPRPFVQRFLILLSVFPTSYFFSAPYTESLFLFLFGLSFYFLRKGNFAFSGIFSGLATLTRPFGILLLPSLCFAWLKEKKLLSLILLFLPTLIAVGIYLLLNQQIYGDPLAFQKILAVNWQKRFALPWVSIADSWKIALSGNVTSYTILVGWAEAVSATLLFLLIPYAFKKLSKPFFVYYLLATVFITSTGFILSSPRYLLSIPPFFILLTHLTKNKLVYGFWVFLSILSLSYLTLFYVTGQWAF